MGRYKIPMADKQELQHCYLVKGMTLTELSERFSVSVYTIREWLLRYDIQLRTRSEAQGGTSYV